MNENTGGNVGDITPELEMVENLQNKESLIIFFLSSMYDLEKVLILCFKLRSRLSASTALASITAHLCLH